MAERYYSEWTANTGEAMRLSLQDSQWVYDASPIKLSTKSPVIREHSSDNEDVLSVFRPCRLTVNIVDEGGTGLEVFALGAFDRWKAVLTVDGDTVFEGLYVPDDLSQQIIFEPNTMQLTFTDGLALLRNFTLLDTDLDVYNVSFYSLLEIINACLAKTGLALPLKVFGNIYANGLMTQRYDDAAADPFFQAEQKIKTYLKSSDDDDEWEDCYTTIERILRDWNATIFQERGYWYIVRVPELATGSPAGTSYTELLYTPTGITDVFSDVELGQSKTIKPVERSQIKYLIRPASKIINTYNYRIPQLLCNPKFTRLGTQIGSQVVGDETWTDYEAPGWSEQNSATVYIRVVTDNITGGRELRRFLVIESDNSDPLGLTPSAAVSCSIDVNEGDRFDFTITWRGAQDSTDLARSFVAPHLSNLASSSFRVLTYTNNPNPQTNRFNWNSTTAPPTNIRGSIWFDQAGGEDLTEDKSATLSGLDYNENLNPRFPFDGYLRLAFFGYNNNRPSVADVDYYLLPVSFSYDLWINDSTQIIGEEHTVTQTTEYNRVLEREIFTSDAPKSNIAGALFVGTTLTSQWGADDYRFGQISILDEMLLRGIPRYKFEGDFRGLVYMDNILTPDFLADRRFFMTGLTVDYGQGISAIYADEVSGPDDLTYGDFDYQFKYLYK